MIGLITPPVGMVIYVLSRIAGISMVDFVKEVAGFLMMCILVVLLISFFPGLVTWIPNWLMGPMR
jgi:TRAP-type C4-dicarboxylate transport system permease large subunit